MASILFGVGIADSAIYLIIGVKDRDVNKSAVEYVSVINTYEELFRCGVCHSVMFKDLISHGVLKKPV